MYKVNQLQSSFKFNLGGYINHAIYWDNLCPKAESVVPQDSLLLKAISEKWGSLDKFKEEFNKMTVAI